MSAGCRSTEAPAYGRKVSLWRLLKFADSIFIACGPSPDIDSGTCSCLSAAACASVAPLRAATLRASELSSRTLRGIARVVVAVSEGRPSRSTMSSAGVTPPIFDGPYENPYETEPSSSPPTYTGEPDIPAQMPPASSISGLDTSTTIRSRPAPIPSWATPSTSTSKGTCVRPCATVQPVPFMPTVTSSTSMTGPQSTA